MKRIALVLLALVLPMIAWAAGKVHVKTSGQECAECHSAQEKVWADGKHGLMGVKCVVCHGSPDTNFKPRPEVNRCRGCHSDAVADMKKPAAKNQTCFACHDHHTVAVKSGAKAGFHREGGAK